jgi:hypothetical protein
MAKNNALHRARLVHKILGGHSGKHVKTPETVELQSKDKKDPDSRFDATSSGVRIYKSDSPGQEKGETTKTIKKHGFSKS